MNKVIKNCLVTRSDALVLKEFCIDKSSPLYKTYKGFNTGVNLQASSVYSMYSGEVCMIWGQRTQSWVVGIFVNFDQLYLFKNLKSVAVDVGQSVDIGTYIGEANKWVTIEYANTYIKNEFPYRVGTRKGVVTMYKDDPMKILDPESTQIQDKLPQYDESQLQGVVDRYDQGLNPSMMFMLSDNKGGD